MRREIIKTDQAPQPVGPYSQGAIAGETVYTAGQIGLGLDNKLAGETITKQTFQVLDNLRAVLEEAGVEFPGGVVKVNAYLADFAENADEFNRAYADYLNGYMDPGNPQYPPRTTIPLADGLPYGALVEMDMIAVLPE